jgi:hypothetical protein
LPSLIRIRIETNADPDTGDQNQWGSMRNRLHNISHYSWW